MIPLRLVGRLRQASFRTSMGFGGHIAQFLQKKALLAIL